MRFRQLPTNMSLRYGGYWRLWLMPDIDYRYVWRRKLDNCPRILVADDFTPWRIQIRSILQARPEWQVICEACDGLEAAQRATELYPDIVLLDIGMPVLNGIEAAKRIRQSSPCPIVIFVTENRDQVIRMAALATGAEGFVVKANVETFYQLLNLRLGTLALLTQSRTGQRGRLFPKLLDLGLCQYKFYEATVQAGRQHRERPHRFIQTGKTWKVDRKFGAAS